MDPPGPPAETVVYELDADDIYKDLRLRGYEYSGGFQSVLKADLHSIHVLYNGCLNTCCAGGVAIRGLKSTIAPRRGARQTPFIQEYQFVPYVDDDAAIEEREARLREYVDVCSAVARSLLEASGEEAAEYLGLIQDYCEVPEDILNQYLTSTADYSGLLRVLMAIRMKLQQSATSLVAAVGWALTAHKNYLQNDILCTDLLNEDSLRPLLDVVVENTSTRKICVLELAVEESDCLLTPRVSELLPLSNALLKTEYNVAHPRPDDFSSQQLPEGAMRNLWHPGSTLVNALPDAELLVACVVPSIPNHLETLAVQLSTLCKEQSFVLLCLRTAFASAEVFVSKFSGISTTLHTKDTALSLLRAYGFLLVGLRSNNWSTLFLLRKKATLPQAAKEKLLGLENTTFSWVETLKDKIVEGEDFWLIAKDAGVSGVVGLINCLRTETGCSRLRCVFDASLKKTAVYHGTLGDTMWKDLLERNLVMNVHRDGQWGSFRYLTMYSCGATVKATEYAFLHVANRGDLSSLQWYESSLRYTTPSGTSGKVICSVYYAPLNFRDVMIATGKLQPDALP
ncbi:hypothetical protein V5799_007171, partial [Amblyomma americanum]